MSKVLLSALAKKAGIVSSGKAYGLKESATLKTFDIPIERLVAHSANPNEQSEQTFDEIVERMRREGFDEPIIVVPEYIKGVPTQKFQIFSGHHRVKAAKTLGYKTVPAVIREGWDADRVKIELIARNQLRGNLNAFKFTELWEDLKKRYDPETLKKQVGLTDRKQFAALFKQVRDQLPPKAKARLDEAKEQVNSVEDLGNVLNEILRSHGSEVDHSMVIFTFGGKEHTYIQIDGPTNKTLQALKKRLDASSVVKIGDVFKALISDNNKIDQIIGTMSNGRKPEVRKALSLKR